MSQISINKYPFQPRWPLAVGPEGPYESIRDAKESIEQNLIFLLQTIPGEWPMNPDLGVGLSKYLFENYNSPELDQLKSRMKTQLTKYLPAVKLLEAKFIHSDSDQDRLNTTLQIVYSVDILGIVDNIDFGLDNTYKTFVKIRTSDSD